MKIKANYLILVVAAGFFCSSVPGQIELLPSSKEQLLISQSHPAFIGIDTLQIVILRYGDISDKDMPVWKQLEANVREKLREASIDLETPSADNILSIPELRIYVSAHGLEGPNQFVFHIRTALARAVCLKDERNPVFKSDIWQTIPVMQYIPAKNIFEAVSNIVLEQVEDFINIYKATNLKGKQPSDVHIKETDSSAASEKQVDSPEYKYVASNSSNIFHKPDCRWAQNISKRNLITYKSKDEAIKAGKRPCKTCNP